MAIPTPPPNTSKATAQELTYDSVEGQFFFLQSTSTYGYIPPDPEAPPIYYDLWYKAANSAKCKGSVTVHNQTAGVIDASVVTVYDEADNILGMGSCVEFEPVTFNLYYYFKVHTTANTPFANCAITIVIKLVHGGPILPSSVVIQGETVKAPLSIIIGNAEAFNFVRHVANLSNPTDTNHTLNGKHGDALPNGVTCIEDQAIKGVTIRNRNFGLPLTELGEDGSISIPLGLVSNDQLFGIRRNANGLNFWLSYLTAGTPIVRSLEVTNGVLGTIYDLGGKVTSMCAKANQVLYYTIEADPMVVRRWDLVNNRRATDLTGAIAVVRDIIITSTGDVIVLYIGTTSAHVYRYNGESGALITAFQLPTINSAARINYAGSNPNQFVIWTHEVGVSLFQWVNISNGQLYDPLRSSEFDANGSYINLIDLYSGPTPDGIWRGPVQRVGAGPASNFWINPVTSRGGCHIPFTNIPEDEYFPPIFPPYQYPPYAPDTPGGTYPLPPDPPETPPVIPIHPPPPVVINPADIGGGLAVIDPSNGVRHDLYQGRNPGETLQAPIIAYVRTAFIGD